MRGCVQKMHNEFKKDYEPYQTMGPLTGIFDQRAAETLNHHADMYGLMPFPSAECWLLMECLASICCLLKNWESAPHRSLRRWFCVETDSRHNAELGVALLDAIIEQRGVLNLEQGARKLARHLRVTKGKIVLDPFVYVSYARKGWMVPNQYWTPGALRPWRLWENITCITAAIFIRRVN
jgi:glyceraldehyde-3-phosphate dehydrogenase (ferredoxin)